MLPLVTTELGSKDSHKIVFDISNVDSWLDLTVSMDT